MDHPAKVSIMLVLALLSIILEYYSIVDGRYLPSKHSVMTIKTKYGDVYDCVDIYKQPAFDHPLLRNHTFQIKPTSYPRGTRRNNSSYALHNVGLKDGGCPNGTVPIQSAQRRNFLKSQLFPRKRDWHDFYHNYAITRSTTGEYHGTRVYMNVWNPQVGNVQALSISQLWLIAGPPYQTNSIEAGWIVYPRLYGDYRTRLFVLWTRDDYSKTGCYNTHCPGFVQVNRRIPVDVSLDPVSTYKGQQFDIKLDVFKDPKTGNWFLLKNDLAIGYWPNVLFNHLNTKAEKVHWGGEAFQCGGCLWPQMGSGHFPEFGYGQAAYMKGIQVIDNKNMVLKDVQGCTTYANAPDFYRINQTGNQILYGGPGYMAK